jgi:hypothetical protein
VDSGADNEMRSDPQNKCFHKWCRIISDHLKEGGSKVSEEMVKELVLLKLGNTTELLGEKIAMRSHKYKLIEAELTVPELKRDFISMSGLLALMEAWAATDLNLILEREEIA